METATTPAPRRATGPLEIVKLYRPLESQRTPTKAMKKPKRRLHSACDLKLNLLWESAAPSTGEAGARRAKRLGPTLANHQDCSFPEAAFRLGPDPHGRGLGRRRAPMSSV